MTGFYSINVFQQTINDRYYVKRKYINCLLPIITVLLVTNLYSQESFMPIDAQNKILQYEGRIGFKDQGIAEIYWPGSSIKIRFKGTGIKAILKD